jgi:predicted aconitase with swiveling domain
MIVLQGRGITGGTARGAALVTSVPMNLTAAHTKFANFFHRSRVEDPHHELFGERIDGRILVLPRCVGSTYTGVVLLELIRRDASPLGIVVEAADTLLVSGVVLADVWFERTVPVVECRDPALFDRIRNHDEVAIDAATGRIEVWRD